MHFLSLTEEMKLASTSSLRAIDSVKHAQLLFNMPAWKKGTR